MFVKLDKISTLKDLTQGMKKLTINKINEIKNYLMPQ